MSEDILKRLDSIEHQLKFFREAYITLHNRVMQGIEVKFDRELHGPAIAKLNNALKEFTDIMKGDSLTGTLSFMGRRLYEIEAHLKTMQEEGVKKNIHLDITMDGYEMVKKKPRLPDIVEEEPIDPEEAVIELLESLTDKQKTAIIHRYGLFDNSKKTFAKIGEIMGFSSSRASTHVESAIRKLNRASARHLVESLTHKEFKKAILGDEK